MAKAMMAKDMGMQDGKQMMKCPECGAMMEMPSQDETGAAEATAPEESTEPTIPCKPKGYMETRSRPRGRP